MGIRRVLFTLLLPVLFFPAAAIASDFPAREIYEAFSPSVVVIKAFRSSGGGMIGAGSIISSDGLVVTNAHVILDKRTDRPYSHISVYVKPAHLTGKSSRDLSLSHKAGALYYDKELDLALLRVQGLSPASRIIALASPETVKVGAEVIAIGHPEQGGFWSLTYGRISGEMRDYGGVAGKDVYQTDTSVNRGNSGGPLLDNFGNMVAVNSSMARVGQGGIPITGVNFAIKSSVVKKWLDGHGITVAYAKRPNTEENVAAKTYKNYQQVSAGESKERKAKIEKTPERKWGKSVLSSDAGDVRKDEKGGIKFSVDVKGVTDEEQNLPGKKTTTKETVEPDKRPKRFITEKRPYDYDSLLQAAEKDLEDMMQDMRQKIKRAR